MAKTGTLKFQAHPYTPQARNSSDFAQYRPPDIFRRRNARSNSEKTKKKLKLLKLEPCKEQICLNCQNPGRKVKCRRSNSKIIQGLPKAHKMCDSAIIFCQNRTNKIHDRTISHNFGRTPTFGHRYGCGGI